MLTLLETTNAIRQLNTELDIIHQACIKILEPENLDLTDPQDLATHIFRAYTNRVNSADLMLAAAIITGRLAGILTKPERVKDTIDQLYNLSIDECTEILTQRIFDKAKTDERFAESLLSLLTRFRNNTK